MKMSYKTKEAQREKAKRYRENNPIEYKAYLKRWREKNKPQMKAYLKKYYLEHEDELVKKAYKWNKDNPEKHKKCRRESVRKYRLKYPGRIKAHKRELYHQRKAKECSVCSATEHLHFHHTDYEKDKGYTLCAKCHKAQHKAVGTLMEDFNQLIKTYLKGENDGNKWNRKDI